MLAHGFIYGEAEAYVQRRQKFLPIHTWTSLKCCLLFQFGDDEDPEKILLLEDSRRLAERCRQRSDAAKLLRLEEEKKTIEDKQSLGDELSLETNSIQEKNETNQYARTSQDWELSKEHSVLQKEDSGGDCESMETASPPSLQSETPALIVVANCTDQPQVSISVLEPGRRHILLGDIERNVVTKDQQVVKEIVYPVPVDLQSEVPEFREQSSCDKSTPTAYQLFDRMLSRSHKLQKLKKMRLFPKSWKFKFKQHEDQHADIVQRYLMLKGRTETIKFKEHQKGCWYIDVGRLKTKRWLRVVGLLSSKKKKTSLLNWKDLLAGYKKNLSYKDTWEHDNGCSY